MVKKPENESGTNKPSSEASDTGVPTELAGPGDTTADDKKADKDTSPQSPSVDSETIVSGQAAPARGSGVSGFLWVLALSAIVIGGGYATLPLWSPYVSGLGELISGGAHDKADLQQEIDKIKQGGDAFSDIEGERDALNKKLATLIDRMGSLEQQLGDMRKMVEATTVSGDAVDANKTLQALSGRLLKIEQSNAAVGTVMDRLNRLEQDVSDATRAAAEPSAKVTAAMGEMAKRLNSLEAGSENRGRQTAEQSNAQALVLAVGQLRETLRGGEPYSQALQTLLRLGGGDPQITRVANSLMSNAASGVVSLKTLTRDYAAVASDIAAMPTAGGGFFAQTLNRLTSLVKVRRVDQAGENSGSAGALTDKAGRALSDGDLQTAVSALQELKNPPATVLAWTRRAKTRLAAERALASLNVYAVSLLAPAVE